jgi:creatinine amidohydrolase/Fe(II)-dependent formamide hydrolase-like protein
MLMLPSREALVAVLTAANAVLLPQSSAAQGEHRPVLIEDMTWTEVRDAIAGGRTTAIIYVGSTEQNGPHMALGKHNFIAHYVAQRIAEELGDALVYPTLPFAPAGDPVAKTGHMRFPGTVSLTPAVFESVVRAIGLSAITAGFRQVYIMGDHGGGQEQLRAAAESLDAAWRPRGVRVRYVADLYYKEKEQTRAYLAERHIAPDLHAGTDDTSELMYIDSLGHWIRTDKLARSDSTQQAITGVDGDPTKATREMGRVLIGYKVADAVAQIRAFRSGQR